MGTADESSQPLPRLALLAAGGTICLSVGDRLDLVEYFAEPSWLSGSDLLARVPEIETVAAVEPLPAMPLESPDVGPASWLELRRRILPVLADPGFAGVLVTHGTSTLEETAYFLDLTLPADKPVVVVGAMRPTSALSADGDLNLVNAARAALAAGGAGQGVLVVLDDTVHAAADVSKTSTSRTDAFRSLDRGPLGTIDAAGVVRLHRRLERAASPAFDPDEDAGLPRVDVLLAVAGQDGALIDAAVAAGARGLVLAGFGAGEGSRGEAAAVARARRQGVAVVQATRVPGGPVVASRRLRSRGLIAAGYLPPWKARILLMLALDAGLEGDALAAAFAA